MNDLISRKELYDKAVTLETEAMETLKNLDEQIETLKKFDERIDDAISVNWAIWNAILIERTAFKHDVYDAPSAQQWIPIKYRPMTDKDAIIFDCAMPEDGQEIWISTDGGYVDTDACTINDDGYYLDERMDFDGVVAWMPLYKPEPYKGVHE